MVVTSKTHDLTLNSCVCRYNCWLDLAVNWLKVTDADLGFIAMNLSGQTTGILADARNRILEDQRRVLDLLWETFKATGKGASEKRVYRELKRADAKAYLEDFGLNLLIQMWEDGRSAYRPTFLGALASGEGNRLEGLIKRYIAFAGNNFDDHPDIEVIAVESIGREYKLSDEELIDLCALLDLAGWWAGGVRGSTNWTSRVPDGIEQVAYGSGVDAFFNEFLESRCSRPLGVREANRNDAFGFLDQFQNDLALTSAAQSSEEDTSVDFEFLSDSELRRQLESDWNEAVSVRQVRAWKSCVILCGVVLEGVLLDVLRRPTFSQAMKKFIADNSIGRKLDEWGLSLLVKSALKITLIRDDHHDLMRVVADFRNLVHPGRQYRKNRVIGREDADVAFSVTRLCIRDISSNLSTRSKNNLA